MSFPDEQTGFSVLVTRRGELDGGDPQTDTGKYYEPVTFTAPANSTVHITMGSTTGDPYIRLLAPNGTVIGVNDDDGSSESAGLKTVTLPTAGQYTIVATSSEPGATFEYLLTIEKHTPPEEEEDETLEEKFADFNERERYNEFAFDYQKWVNSGGDNITNITNRGIYVDQDIVVVNFTADGQGYNAIDTWAVLTAGLENVTGYYAEPGHPVNETWIPDRIYYRAKLPNGGLYRTFYLDTDWALKAHRTDDPDPLTNGLLVTTKFGPAHDSYVAGANNSSASVESREDWPGNGTGD